MDLEADGKERRISNDDDYHSQIFHQPVPIHGSSQKPGRRTPPPPPSDNSPPPIPARTPPPRPAPKLPPRSMSNLHKATSAPSCTTNKLHNSHSFTIHPQSHIHPRDLIFTQVTNSGQTFPLSSPRHHHAQVHHSHIFNHMHNDSFSNRNDSHQTISRTGFSLSDRTLYNTNNREINEPQNHDIVPLDHMRPASNRRQNEYVGSPHLVKHSPISLQIVNDKARGPHPNDVPPAPDMQLQTNLSIVPVLIQPKKHAEPDKIVAQSHSSHSHSAEDSIICLNCGKCKCSACKEPKACFRTRWICDKQVECSPQKLVDYCSCFYCVQCIFFHCCKDSNTREEFSDADDPLSCEKPNCCIRWMCISMLSMFLPCLCCYWPFKCAVNMCTRCRNFKSRGCHCAGTIQNASKRLLDSSETSNT